MDVMSKKDERIGSPFNSLPCSTLNIMKISSAGLLERERRSSLISTFLYPD